MAKTPKPIKYTHVKSRAKKQARLALVPHKANQYRPLLVRRWGLALILLLVFVMQASYNFASTGSVLGERSDISAESLLVATNNARSKNNLATLSPNEALNQAAEAKAADMIKRDYWAHNGPDGTEPWVFIQAAGYSYASAGENLARNFNSVDATVDAWMASPDHRANLLENKYQDVGFAVAHGQVGGRPADIIVAMYGQPARQGAVAGVSAPVTTLAKASSLSPIGRFGVAVQNLTPAAIGSLILILLAAIVALAAHTYRDKLPKRLKKSWYKHHGLIKSTGLAGLAVIMVVLYGGGSL